MFYIHDSFFLSQKCVLQIHVSINLINYFIAGFCIILYTHQKICKLSPTSHRVDIHNRIFFESKVSIQESHVHKFHWSFYMSVIVLFYIHTKRFVDFHRGISHKTQIHFLLRNLQYYILFIYQISTVLGLFNYKPWSIFWVKDLVCWGEARD